MKWCSYPWWWLMKAFWLTKHGHLILNLQIHTPKLAPKIKVWKMRCFFFLGNKSSFQCGHFFNLQFLFTKVGQPDWIFSGGNPSFHTEGFLTRRSDQMTRKKAKPWQLGASKLCMFWCLGFWHQQCWRKPVIFVGIPVHCLENPAQKSGKWVVEQSLATHWRVTFKFVLVGWSGLESSSSTHKVILETGSFIRKRFKTGIIMPPGRKPRVSARAFVLGSCSKC